MNEIDRIFKEHQEAVDRMYDDFSAKWSGERRQTGWEAINRVVCGWLLGVLTGWLIWGMK